MDSAHVPKTWQEWSFSAKAKFFLDAFKAVIAECICESIILNDEMHFVIHWLQWASGMNDLD